MLPGEQGDVTWKVFKHQGMEVIIQNTGALPPIGAATLSGAQPSELKGVWDPAADKDPPATKLKLSAKTPFTYFRNNSSEVAEGFDRDNPSQTYLKFQRRSAAASSCVG